jgi:hypothetical protein
MAHVEKPVDQMGAEESGSTGYEDTFAAAVDSTHFYSPKFLYAVAVVSSQPAC